MTHVFVSYASEDKSFTFRLANDLAQLYRIWIDKEQITGGLEWERKIDAALNECLAFIVIVSPNSNQSKWVARETLRADELKKFVVPVFLGGDLPLRLLDLQYIDFQGGYEGGFRDLLEVLKKEISPGNIRRDDANRLIGEGLRSYLDRNYPRANSLIGQALVHDPEIADSVAAFWKAIKQTQETDWAGELMPEIEIRERANLLKESVFSQQAGAHIDYYQWSVEIAASNEILDKIDFVKYTLHETFPKPLQIIRNRRTNFRLDGRAWGTFPIPVEIHFEDGTVGHGVHELHFENRQVPLE